MAKHPSDEAPGSGAATGGNGGGSEAAPKEDLTESVAEQNRRKLQEHLAKLQQQGVPPKADKAAGAGAKGAPKPPPRPPPKPQGWEAWKQAHSGRMHKLRPVDMAEVSREADFKLLECKPGASQDELKRNFNRLAKKYHPDLGGDPEIFHALRQAYNRLTGGG